MDGTAVLIGVLAGAVPLGAFMLYLLKGRGDSHEVVVTELKASQSNLEAEKVLRAKFEERSQQTDSHQRAAEEAREEWKLAQDQLQQATITVQRLELQLESSSKAIEAERTSLQSQISERERILRESLEQEKATLAEQIQKREQALELAETKMKEAFESLSAKALKENRQQFNEQVKETLDQQKELLNKDLDKRHVQFDKLIQPLTESLDEYSKKVEEMDKLQLQSSTKMEANLEKLFEVAQIQTKNSNDMKNLFRGPGTRGRMGELMLKRLLDEAGMQEGIHYDLQVSSSSEEGRSRPDCIVKLPSSRRIVIDSKAVWNAYEQSLDIEDENERRIKLVEYAKSVRATMDSLAKRDYAKADDIELVVMYIPIEAAFLAAYQADPDLQSYGWNRERKIVLTAPTNLMGLLRIVMLDWRQFETQKNAHEITKLGAEVVDRIRVVADHISDVGKGLNSASVAYDKAVASIDRNLMTSAQKLQKLHVATDIQVKQLPIAKHHTGEFKKEELKTLPSKPRLKELEGSLALDFIEEEQGEI